MATITLKAGMVWRGEYDSSATYNKLDVVKKDYAMYVCTQQNTNIDVTNRNYWETNFDASSVVALLEEKAAEIQSVLDEGNIYTPQVGTVSTGNTSNVSIVNNEQTKKSVFNFVLEKGEKGDKGDKGDRGEKGDTVIIGEGEEYTLYNQTGNHTDGAMTQAAVTEEFEKLDETYAHIDGYYESMGVGTATNLKGQNTVDAEFAYRKSGGNVEVQDGNAMIEAIKGNTIAWNQLMNPNDYENSKNVGSLVFVKGQDNSVVVSGSNDSGNTAAYTLKTNFTLSSGHKYLLRGNNNSNENIYLQLYGGVRANDFSNSIFVADAQIINFVRIRVANGAIIQSSMTYTPVLFDLSLIYGLGNEPATVEQFEQDYFNWFGKPLTYEPYDAGSLHNTKVSALKTTGFNQWDEEWEQGQYNTATGEKIASSTTIRSKNYCACLPNTAYYNNKGNGIRIMFYDKDKQYLNYIYDVTNFTTPTNACYFTFYITNTTTYNNDICINLSDANRNGEYEPYKESTLPLNVTTLTGKLNGEGSSVVVFADGMNSDGDVHDEICVVDGVTKAIKRVGASHEVLAEPEVYVLDDFSLPKLYHVANGGTEEQLSNSPNSLPATLSIRYGLNAAAFIQNAPKNYISKESMSNFLSNLGSAMGGTWSMVWNSSTNKYDFSFTQNRSVDVEQPIEDK